MGGGFKVANDKCEPVKTSRLNGPETETRDEPQVKAVGIKASRMKVKSRGTQGERGSLFMKGRKIARQPYTPAPKLLNLTTAHRSMPRQEAIKPKRVQALCRGYPWSLTRYQLSLHSSGFASSDRGHDWVRPWTSACDAGTWSQRFNCNPTGRIPKGHKDEIEHRIREA